MNYIFFVFFHLIIRRRIKEGGAYFNQDKFKLDFSLFLENEWEKVISSEDKKRQKITKKNIFSIFFENYSNFLKFKFQKSVKF